MTYLAPLTEDEKRRRRRGTGEVLQDGEYVSFSLAFRDSAPSTALMLTDSDPRVISEVARQRMAHDAKFSFMGDQAPAFDADRATMIAKTQLADNGKSVVEALRGNRYLPDATISDVAAARAGMLADMKAAPSQADVRNAIRDARYQ